MSPRFLGGRDYHDTSKSKNNVKYDIHNYSKIFNFQLKYDLEERTAKFAESIIGLAGKVAKNAITLPIISQIVRAGTSVGANYCEANGASSKKEFKNKIYICKKEIQETKYWLRIISNA